VGRKKNRELEDPGSEAAIAALAAAQHGVVSLDQLRARDLSAGAAAKRAQRGALHRQHRGVYAVGHRSIGREGLLQTALLACGHSAVISHGTAAAFWGLRDQWPTLVDVTVPNQAGRKIDGVRCRRCRYPSPAEILIREGIVFTSPARTMVDLAGLLGTPSLRRVVERAAVLKLLDIAALDRSLIAAEGRRGVKALWRIADEWRTEDGSSPDVRGDFEALVLPRLLALGVPRPVCNRTLTLGGDRLMVDFLWEEQRLVVETDGKATHATPVAFQRDRHRDQILVAAGYRVARATWDQMHRELEAVVTRISRALDRAPS
jgi:hypothetical protein